MDEQEWIECPHCQGTKMEFPDCEECEGRGWVDDPADGGTMTCPECNAEQCSECDGEGLVAAQHPVTADKCPALIEGGHKWLKKDNYEFCFHCHTRR